MSTITTSLSAPRAKLLAALVAVVALAGCHRSSGGGSGGNQPPPSSSRTYSATVTGVEITRPADGLNLAVSGLPAQGAVLTVP